MTADNQQERLDANWVVGFVDGEGCFHVSINKQPKMTLGWQVLPEFRVVQHERNTAILQRIQEFFGCGRVVVNHGDRKELRIRGLDALEKVVECFRSNPLKTTKQRDFEIFAKIISMMREQDHLTQEGLLKIAELASMMNRQTRRTVLSRIPRDCTPNSVREKIQSEPCSDTGTLPEMTVRHSTQTSRWSVADSNQRT